MADENREPDNNQPHTEDEDYKEAARSTADYAEYQKPHKESNPIWRKLGIAAGIVLVLIVLVGGGYWLAKGHKTAKSPAQTSQTSQSEANPTGITKATKHYDSANFNLGFDYPADWTVTDTGNGQLTVKSPAVHVKDSGGQLIEAKIIMTIRRNDQKLPEFDKGNAIAAKDSEKVAYAQPTQTQRANTYLSFLAYADTNQGMDGIYITGDNGYKAAQAIPKLDVQKSDPIISVSFSKLSGSAVSISTSNWDDQSFSAPIKSMLQSLTIT